MSCNNCNNCAQCNPVYNIPVAAPPICPTTACEEYISSDCVNNEVTAACSSVYTNPNTGDQTAVGYSINSGSTMTEVISALTSPQNCLFSENYLGAALQYIGNSQVLTTILCSIVQDCIAGCVLDLVTQLTFNPVEVDQSGSAADAWWTTNFYPHLGSDGKPDYTYTLTITDTTASVPTVYQLVLTPAQQQLLLDPLTGLLNIDFHNPAYALEIIEGGIGKTTVVPSGHTYETVITSEFLGQSCDSDSFTLVVPQSPLCPACEYIITIEPAPSIDTPDGCIYVNITSEYPAGIPNEPYAYAINVIDNVTGDPISSTPYYYVTGSAVPACGYTFCVCDLTGTDYTVQVTAVCSFNPLYCTGTVETINVTSVPPATCAPPDITNITVTP